MKKFGDLAQAPVLRQVLVATGPIVITIVLGMLEGYSAILLPQLEYENSTIKIDTQLSSWIASISALPMAGGCVVGGYFMETIGRRSIHIWACVPLIVGWFLIAAAPNATIILAGRFLTGISDGLLGPATGVYIAETAQPSVRGVLIMATGMAITAGLFLVHLLGTFLTWRLTAWISGAIPIPFAILMFYTPESPTFLAKMNKIDQARKAFHWCRGNSKESQKELEELIKRQEELNNAPSMSISEQMRSLSKPEFWKPTVIITLLFFTAQAAGTNAMSSYSITIIQQCGLSGEMFDEYVAMITIDSFRLVSCITSCFLVKKMNRRSLAMLSGYGVTLFLLLLCFCLYISPFLGFNTTIVQLVFLVAYVSFISLGLTPLSWTMMGEVFPLAYRGLGTVITSLMCYVFLYLVVQTFPPLLSLFGNINGVFISYGACTLVGTILLMAFLPETKDKPLYVIEDHFKSKKHKRRGSVNSDSTREC